MSQIAEEFKSDQVHDLSGFVTNIEEIIDEFNIKFKEFEMVKNNVSVINNNPLGRPSLSPLGRSYSYNLQAGSLYTK